MNNNLDKYIKKLNTFVANAINAGVNGGIFGIASKIPLGSSVLKGLLTAAGWTSAAGKVGSTIANHWDTIIMVK